ncbi:LETM1-related biofilm-associated protein [Winogradskyella maritima]|uniref:LETM1-related biofilm-associated protein n=1 Tax=Winogradskyella maritima TaxID=1517766 RepID=A0ABV8AKC3_9FLAO|nr:LETM1-related biofilm-associated protein [Winogradskyella maritima]
MNPSAKGWIKKLLKSIPEDLNTKVSPEVFYNQLKQTGFIFGSNLSIYNNAIDDSDFTEIECCKVNLLLAFQYVHQLEESQLKFETTLVTFYNQIVDHKRWLRTDIFKSKDHYTIAEELINKRIQVDDNPFTKQFNAFLVNALLFIDVLAYHHFLRHTIEPKIYLQQFEGIIESILKSILANKKDKDHYHEDISRLFEASMRTSERPQLELLDFKDIVKTHLEKQYVVDITCMVSWTDQFIDTEEFSYLKQLQAELEISTDGIINSVDDLNLFYENNRAKIKLLKSNNGAKTFYDTNSKLVSRLIKRNSKRLLKELSESKEALYLLGQSTQRTLTEEEQKKIQNQLLDIFKSIPSLAIFMLPGGMLLLPLFIRFIPKLLPSAFDDNRIEE